MHGPLNVKRFQTFYGLKLQPHRQGVTGGFVEPKLMVCPALQ
jgi:hypothetical protein